MNENQSTELTLYQQAQATLAELSEKVKALEVNDETVAFAGESLAVAKRLVKVLDDERKEKKEPYFQKAKDVDAKYGLLIKPCEAIADKVEKLIAAYNRQKREEAERLRQQREQMLREAEQKRMLEERRIREEQERQVREAEAKRVAEQQRINEEHARKMAELEAASNAEGAKAEELLRQRREAEEKRIAEEQRLKREQELQRMADEEARRRELLKAQMDAIVAPVAMPEAKEKIGTTFGNVKIREHYEATLVDISLVPREWMAPDEKKIKAAINAKENPVRAIPGFDIHPET